MIISNCGITLSDAEVLKPCVMSKTDPNYKKLGGFHTGLDIKAENIFTIYQGRIVYVGKESSGYVVFIQTGDSFCIGYKHLLGVSVNLNDLLEPTYTVGYADKYVHVEVYTREKSIFPVRVGNDTFYKQDANLLFNGGLNTDDMYAYQQNYTDDINMTISDITNSILSNNEG